MSKNAEQMAQDLFMRTIVITGDPHIAREAKYMFLQGPKGSQELFTRVFRGTQIRLTEAYGNIADWRYNNYLRMYNNEDWSYGTDD